MLRSPAVVTASALALGAALLSTTPALTATAASDAKTRCQDDTVGNARVMAGQSKRIDPNTMTQVEAAAMSRDFRERTAGLRPDERLRRIPVYVHVIRGEGDEGAIGNGRIHRQIRVLNHAFAGFTSPHSHGTRFRFDLAGIDRTRNEAWYDAGASSKEQRAMKRALRVGDAGTLNIYVNNPRYEQQLLLGYATYPIGYRQNPALDGVVILTESTPGGPLGSQYSRGDTATHEVGHWLGLFHTFQGGCGRRGDYVTDTPREAHPQFNCVHKYDTCKEKGLDPVHNFMDYGYDRCLTQFTQGQAIRMRLMWLAYRS